MRATLTVLLVAAAAALGACGGGAGPAPPPPPLTVGLVANTLGYGTDLGREQDLAVRTGVRTLREELNWGALEPRPGARRWAAFDRLLVASAHRRLRLLVLLHGTPRWAQPADGGLPTDAAAYGRYVRDVVARYGPGGSFWRAHRRLDPGLAPRWFELFNEPWFAPPQRSVQDARRYAALAAAGLRGGRAASAQARFLVAADASYVPGGPEAARWLARLDAADRGVLDAADGLAVHPYSRDPAAGVAQVARLAALVRRRGRALPIWVTEVGWSTCRIREAGCVAPADQAARLRAFLRGIRGLPRATVPAVFVYSLRDLPGPLDPREESFGVLALNGARKPAWAVLHAFAAR